MNASSTSSRALVRATIIGAILQVAMVVAGHFIATIALAFGPLGMAISLVAGYLCVQWGRPETKAKAVGQGALAGGICAFLGIAVSVALGDVLPVLLALGTLSSAVTGALGGFVRQLLFHRKAARV